VLGATLVIAHLHAGGKVPLLASKPMVAVGLISYSLYLWHWPLLAIDRAVRVGETPLGTRLALVAVAFVLAVLSYRYIEQPFRRARVRPARAVAIGVVCAAALSCTAFAMADRHEPKPPQPQLADWRYCHLQEPGMPIRAQLPKCVQELGPKVVLWGDSFAEVWQDHAVSLANARRIPMVRAINPGCPPVPVDVPQVTTRATAFCREQYQQTLAYLKTYGANTVILAGWWANVLRHNADAGLVETVRAIPARRIVVVGAIPEMPEAVEKCVALGVSCDIPRAEYERSAAATKRMTAELAKLPNVEVIELGDWMCDADKCRGVRNGVPLYFKDNHHASPQAVAGFLTHQGTRSAE
jgi:hypothetical protein